MAAYVSAHGRADVFLVKDSSVQDENCGTFLCHMMIIYFLSLNIRLGDG